MNKEIVLVVACVALVIVNLGAFRYLGIFGLLVMAGSWPAVEKLLDILKEIK